MPNAIARTMNSHRQERRPCQKSAHPIPRKDSQSKTTATAAEIPYFKIFWTFFSIIRFRKCTENQ